jgi:NAD(P)-dependent dehydrogenase (short-subunit alcohol dehydrogenase family)
MKDWKMGRTGLIALGVAGLSLAVATRRPRSLDLRGRVAVVTGGGRGLGLAITRELLRCGCRVAICGRDGEIIRRSVEELERQGFEIIGKACDASDPEQVKAFVDVVINNYGAVDILVNNAGQCFVGPAAELAPVDMQSALRNIFWVQYHPTMALLPHMRNRGFGRIVNVTSLAGKLPIPHQSAYTAAKYAATGWSQTLSIELASEGIEVSTITPPPLRNGAPLHVNFNGDREAEFQWFTHVLTSPMTASTAQRTARVVASALRRGDRERAVSAMSWLSARAFGVAPNLLSHWLGWVNRKLPPSAAPGLTSPMRLGYEVVEDSSNPAVHRLAQRARADEARHLPDGASPRGAFLRVPTPPHPQP